MRIFFPDKFLSQARSHQALELIKRLKPDQLAGPRMDRYVFKEVGRRSFLAIGTEQTISDQQVFIWLQVLHRNSREWREFQWEPGMVPGCNLPYQPCCPKSEFGLISRRSH